LAGKFGCVSDFIGNTIVEGTGADVPVPRIFGAYSICIKVGLRPTNVFVPGICGVGPEVVV
jgi:hypothetical protein